MLSRLLKLLEWAGHGSNAWTVLGWMGWTVPIAAFGAGAVTFFSSAVEGWSPTAVWLASLAASVLAAFLAFIVLMIIGRVRNGRRFSTNPVVPTTSAPQSSTSEPAKVDPPKPYYTVREREAALDVLNDLKLLMKEVEIPAATSAQKLVDNWGIVYDVGRDEYVKQLVEAKDSTYRFNEGLGPILSRLPHGQINIFPASGPPHGYFQAFNALIGALERLPMTFTAVEFDDRIGPFRTSLLNAFKERQEWFNYLSMRMHQETERFRNVREFQ